MEDAPPVFPHAPPLDPAWLEYESAANLLAPKLATDPVTRQPLYAAECRVRNAAMLAPGARDHHLAEGVVTVSTSLPSSKGGHTIPVRQYDRTGSSDLEWIMVYYHGGGLTVGEADSEDLSCRRLVKDSVPFLPGCRLYSVGYRLKPQHPAHTCVDDSIDAFTSLARLHGTYAKIIVIGSSSGGQLAALVTQHALRAGIPFHGVLLRCPVTSDAFRGLEYVPEKFRSMHTSARDASFQTSLFSRLDMDGPRDGLKRMPLEAEAEELKGMARTWVQLCTNDGLYSDGACYVRLLKDAGVVVHVDVVMGWPHTFWLKAPHLDRALATEEAMIDGLRWIAMVEG